MGNHVAGGLIALHVAQAVAARQPDQSALDVLDAAMAKAKASPGYSPDVEFESTNPDKPDETHPDYMMETDPHPKATLGMLLLEAFAPNGVADQPRYQPMLDGTPPGGDDAAEEAACDAWYAEVQDPFRARYGLC